MPPLRSRSFRRIHTPPVQALSPFPANAPGSLGWPESNSPRLQLAAAGSVEDSASPPATVLPTLSNARPVILRLQVAPARWLPMTPVDCPVLAESPARHDPQPGN